jgi:hypothetical protein
LVTDTRPATVSIRSSAGNPGGRDRSVVRALVYAWEQPDLRAGLRHLIDLDKVTALLATLAAEDRDRTGRR